MTHIKVCDTYIYVSDKLYIVRIKNYIDTKESVLICLQNSWNAFLLQMPSGKCITKLSLRNIISLLPLHYCYSSKTIPTTFNLPII